MSPARRRGSPRCAASRHEVLVVSAALLVWPLVTLDTVSVAEVSVVVAGVVCEELVVVVPAEVVCGSGDPAKVTAPSASANDARVAAATRRWIRALEVLRVEEDMQASCACALNRA